MRSSLIFGHLMHARRTEYQYQFKYPVYSFLLKLADLPHLDKTVTGFGHNRRALAAVFDEDHFDNPRRTIEDNLRAYLRRQGVDHPGGDIYMLTNARIFGYVFNPISMFYCYDRQQQLQFMVAEVHNTHGERFPYLLSAQNALPAHPGDEKRQIYRYEADKAFYVSPLIGMNARYEFAATAPDVDAFSLHIDEFRDGERFFQARLWGRREPLSPRAFRRALWRYPWMTAQVIFLIHWHAVKTHLWGGVPIQEKPAVPPGY